MCPLFQAVYVSGKQALWLEDLSSVPALPAKATFMAGSVSSMMQEIRVIENDYWQWFRANKVHCLTFLPGLL